MSAPINLLELEALAQSRLPKNAFDYYASGAHDEITLRDNRAAFERIRLAYRVLVDVSERDPSTSVLGLPSALPVLVAPTAFQRMAHPDGELATARAAGAAGVPMINSTLSNRPWTDDDAVVAGGKADKGLGKRSLLNKYSVLALSRGIVDDPHEREDERRARRLEPRRDHGERNERRPLLSLGGLEESEAPPHGDERARQLHFFFSSTNIRYSPVLSRTTSPTHFS